MFDSRGTMKPLQVSVCPSMSIAWLTSTILMLASEWCAYAGFKEFGPGQDTCSNNAIPCIDTTSL